MNRKQSDARLVRRYVRNILKVYNDAPNLTRRAGAVWYKLESDRCRDYANRHGLTLDAVAGAAAAISPGLRWEHVFSYVHALRRDSRAIVPTYCREFARRAVRCLRGEPPENVLSGDKVTAFYQLLAGKNMDAVVVDGHAFNIARGIYTVFRKTLSYSPPSAARVTPRRYRLAAQAYQQAAESLYLYAHAVQATTWIHWRNINR